MQTKLVNKLGQRLALTPQLTQSLKVLAMNAIELDTYIEETLESNPLLEMEQESRSDTDNESTQTESERDWQEEGDNRWEMMYTPSAREYPDNREQLWQDEQTLGETLHEQADRQPMPEQTRQIAHALIDSLESDGYFRADVDELAGQLGISSDALVETLENVVQELEPAGIGARNLTECLLLQLDPDDAVDTLVRRLLLHFSDHLFEDDEALAKLAGCTTEELTGARARMRRLDAFPGHGLHGHDPVYVRPEIIFLHGPDGQIQVEVPSHAWHGVRLNDTWQGHRWQGSDRDFMDAALKEAKWLIYALDQRCETLRKVGICLAKRQKAFLDHGLLGLKPLTLQDVAEEVELHESTISRVTNGKYAQTPLGLIEMKRFFSGGLPTRGGGAISVYRVQQRIKALIDSEPTGRPISDQAIADRLCAEGIEIARRTVAKYRESLGLPTSSQRKRQRKPN